MGSKQKRPEPDSNRRQTDLQSVSHNSQIVHSQSFMEHAGEMRGKSGGAEGAKTEYPGIADDSALWAVAEAWPGLPEALKAGILAMVRAAMEGKA